MSSMLIRLHTAAGPLFAAEGTRKNGDDEPPTKHIFVFASYEKAQDKAKDLIHVSFYNVSVYRLDE